MKKWVAILLASVLALNLVACDMSNISEEDMEYVAQIVDEASAGIEDELQNGDLEERWDEFTSNLNLDAINPADLHWEDLTLEDYEALGISVADLEEAGLVLDELGLSDLEPSDIDFEKLGLVDLQSLGLGDLTLEDLAVDVDLDALDMKPSELFLFLSSLSEEDLEAIGLGGLDLTNPDLSQFDPEKLDLDKLQGFLADLGIDPVDLVVSNIDLNAVDLNNPLIKDYLLSQLKLNGIDLESLGINPDDIDLNAIDLAALGIDLKNFDLDNFDLDKINLDAIDFDKLGIRPQDLKLENLDLNNPMIKDYLVSTLAAEGIDLARLGVNIDDLDLNAVDLKALGIDLNNLDLENLDISSLNLDALDLESLGIKLEDLNLNDPIIKDALLDELAAQGFDLKSLGIDPAVIDLNAIDLEEFGIDLKHFDPENFDLTKINLDAIDFDKLGIRPSDLKLENLDLNNPMIKDFVVGELAAEGIDLASLGVDLDKLNLNAIDLEDLGIDLNNLDLENLDLDSLNLAAIDLDSLGVNLEDLDLNNPMIKDTILDTLAAEGIDLASLGINPEDLDFNAIDLKALGIDPAHLDLNALDLNAIDLGSIDLESLGIKLEDIDLNNPMIQEFIQNELNAEGINLENYGISLSDIDLNNPIIKTLLISNISPEGFDISQFSLDNLGISLDDLNLENLGLDSPILQNYVFSQFDLDDLNLDALHLEDYGIDLDELDLDDLSLEDLDINLDDLDLEDLSLEQLGISVDDIDLEKLDLEDLDLKNLNMEELGLNPEDIRLDDIELGFHLEDLSPADLGLDGLGLEETGIIPEDLDITVKLDDLSLDDLEEFMNGLDFAVDLSDLDVENLNFDNPLIRDFLTTEINLEDIDLSGIDLGELSLDDLNLQDLSFLGLEDLNLEDLELEGLNLDDLHLDELNLADLDPSQLTIGDLAAFGLSIENLEQAGLVPQGLMEDVNVLVNGINSYGAEKAKAAEAAAEEPEEEAAEEPEKEAAAEEAVEEESAAEEAAEEPAEDKEEEEEVAEAAAEEPEEEAAEEPEEEAEEQPEVKEEAAEEEAVEEEPAAEETAEAAEETTEAADDGNVTFLPAEKPAPQDDFYSAIDFDEARTAEIPRGYSQWNPVVVNSLQTDRQIRNIVKGADRNLDPTEPGSTEYRIGALYETLMDMDERNEVGVEPIMKWLKAYDKAKDLKGLLKADLQMMEETTESGIISLYMDYNPTDSKHYVIVIDSCAHAPNREMMVSEELGKFRDQYLIYLGQCFRAAGYDDVDSVLRGAATYALQSMYEEHTLSPQDLQDPDKTSNLFTEEELQKKFKNLPVMEWIKAMGLDTENGYGTYKITDIKALEYLDSIYTEENFELLRNNAIATVIDRYSTVINEELYEANKIFTNTLKGVTEPKPFDEKVVDQVQNLLPTDVGMLYADQYCSKEAKDEVTKIVMDVQDAYYEIIENSDWMTEETKEKALEKLDTMKIHVAYPDKWFNTEQDAEILIKDDGGTAFTNALNILVASRKATFETAKKRVNRNEWIVTPQTVNAFYNPLQNEIYICAAIMQGTIYDPEADYDTNLGGIGFVIGHEMSHAFDSNGAKYDADGNLNMWWTEEDWKGFEEKAQKVVDYYGGYKVIPDSDICVNGELTVSENLADLGGAKVIEKICDGDSARYEKAATNQAKVWATKMTPDSFQMRQDTDVHAPAKARVNVPLQMTDLFYDAFDVKEEDGMYVAPEDRVGIW